MQSNALSVSNALREIARDFPREFPQALGTVGLGLRKKMRAAIPSGSSPLSFSPWNSFTRILKFRRASKYMKANMYHKSVIANKTASKESKKNRRAFIRENKRKASALSGFGGQLPNAMIYQRTGNGSGASVQIGYRKNEVGSIASAFQSALNRPLTKEERHFRHTIQGKHIERAYRRPARPIMQPFAESKDTAAYILDVVNKRIFALITKRANRARAA